MKGILYGIGVGPGDPELMTLKACRIIRENQVIAVPGENPKDTVAYKIAVQAVPELADKELLPIYMPMVMDKAEQQRQHEAGAAKIAEYLDKGINVVFLTLGDVTIYSTFTYLQFILEKQDYTISLVSGIPSFCAAAARTNVPLSIWQEPIHVIPARQSLDITLPEDGTVVLMKSGSKMAKVKDMLRSQGRQAVMVMDCGMPTEQIFNSVDEIPDDAGYYSLIIATTR
ncbi:MAG: precorrin-2 C(20)-methyltransferase [Lachnospiraceae bacterium]|nr:precorrin-2 C(20)-methyltransferase [Lachnospiraceae bacterium]